MFITSKYQEKSHVEFEDVTKRTHKPTVVSIEWMQFNSLFSLIT